MKSQRSESCSVLQQLLLSLCRKLGVPALFAVFALCAGNVFGQTSSQQTAPSDPSAAPVEKPTPKKDAPTSSALSAAGMTAGAGGLPGIAGRVPGMAKVESDGAGSYAIPIVVPPGTASIQPNLALVYNSHDGNGPFGVGWSLTGLPTIHRCAKRLEPDGTNGSVSFDTNDRYCLDGARLMLVDNTHAYGANDAEYRTEIDNGIKIISKSQAGSGPAYFIARTKEGRIMEFGNSTDSAINVVINGVERSDIRVWALTKIYDTKLNSLTVTYHKNTTDGHYRPLQIAYTSNVGGLSANRFVVFEPNPPVSSNRSDIYAMFVGGAQIKVTERITNIKTYVGSVAPANLVKDYRLGYADETTTVTKRSRLITVSECDKNGNCLPTGGPFDPLTNTGYKITYQDGGNNTFTTSNPVTNHQFNGGGLWVGDFNGDGKQDFAVARANTNTIFVHLSDGAGNYTPVGTPYNSGDLAQLRTVAVDVNGDGFTDLVSFPSGKLNVFLAKNDGSGTFYNVILSTPTASQYDSAKAWALDVNGDGRTDIVSYKNGKLWTYISNFSASTGSFTPPPSGFTIPGAQFNPLYVWTGDVNGDGMQDLLTHESGTLYAHLSDGTGNTWTMKSTTTGAAFDRTAAWIGDFNSDGLTDIATRNTGPLYTYFAKGDGTFVAGTPYTIPPNTFMGSYTWAIDINGDGRADVLSITWVGNVVGMHAHLSKGDGTYFVVSTIKDTTTVQPDWIWVGDFTGDAKGDVLTYFDLGPILTHPAHINSATDMFPDLVTAIINPFQGVSEITYRPLTDTAVYIKDTGPDASPGYPIFDVQAPLYVVSNMTAREADSSFSYPYSYLYKGAKAHVKGRGLLGFRVMDALDTNAGARTITFYHQGLDGGLAQFNQNFPKVGQADTVEIEETACSLPNNARVDSKNFYDVSTDPYPLSSPKIRRVFLTQTDKNEYECTASPRYSKTTFTFDSFGNPTQTKRHGVISTTNDDIDERTDWVVNLTLWLHKPKTVQLFNGAGQKLREKRLHYDNLGHGDQNMPFGLLTKEEVDAMTGNSADNPVITYEYDPTFGVLTKSTDPRNCRTVTTYESTQTFPASVTTCDNIPSVNFLMTYQWDLGLGVKTEQIDWNSQPTEFRYDSFGRPTKVWSPLDSEAYPTIEYSYLQWGVVNAQRVETKRRTEHGTTNHLWTDEYLDGFGRVDQTQRQGPAGTIIVEDIKLNSRNQVKEKFVPRFSTETALSSIKFDYDALGRETKMTHSDPNRTTTRFYEPGKITFTDEKGVQKIHLLDAHDRLVQVQEKNNAGAQTYYTDYTYDAAGSLIQVRNNAGHYTSMAYDKLGRKEAMCDPNMGTLSTLQSCSTGEPGAWVYTYFPAGDLKTQRDARLRTLTFDYDELGRPKTKKEGAQTLVTFTYDVTQNISPPVPDNPKGRLTMVVDTAATTKNAYDKLGRTSKAQRLILGAPHETTQFYDALNRVTSEQFPDTDVVNYTYDGPWLGSVANYINSITYNARGQKKTLTYANNITTTWEYNDQTNDPLKNFRVKTRVTTNGQQNFAFSYDDVGNILSIADNQWTGDRTFQYDDLNRLIYASGEFGPNQTNKVCGDAANPISYNSIGDILNKCNSQAFVYGNAMHPSAVTSNPIIGKNYAYDNNGNMIQRGTETIVPDVDNRISSIGTTSMEYDYTGIRIKKFTSGVPTPMLYPFPGYEIDQTGTITKFIRIGIETFASKRGTNRFFYHNDHLGGVNTITDINGARCQLNEYDPWGSVSRSEGPSPGTQPTCDPTHRFNGKELDPETGLYYYGARYYDGEISRFISPDSFIQAPSNPQNLNRYSYVINNPQNYVDPSGHFFGLLFNVIFSKNKTMRIIGDPIGYLLSKIPKKANAGMNIFGGLLMLASENPAGAFFVASGAMGFGKDKGAQIGSQLLAAAGATSATLNAGAAPPTGSSSPGDSPKVEGGPLLNSGAGGVFTKPPDPPKRPPVEMSIGPQFGVRLGGFKFKVNFGSIVNEDSVQEEYALAADLGGWGFFGFHAKREVSGRIDSSAHYWMLYRQLQKRPFKLTLWRSPFEISTEGLTVGAGYALPMVPSFNVEVDVGEVATGLFNDIVENIHKPVPRR